MISSPTLTQDLVIMHLSSTFQHLPPSSYLFPFLSFPPSSSFTVFLSFLFSLFHRLPVSSFPFPHFPYLFFLFLSLFSFLYVLCILSFIYSCFFLCYAFSSLLTVPFLRLFRLRSAVSLAFSQCGLNFL